MRTIAFLLLAFVSVPLLTQPALAYIDPGTASIAVQLLIAGFVVAAGGTVYYYRQVKATLSRWFSWRPKGPTESK